MLGVVVILLLSWLLIKYQEDNGCVFAFTNTMSSNYPPLTKTATLIQKHIIRPHSDNDQDQQRIPKLIIQTNERDQIPLHMLNTIEETTHQNSEYSYWFFNSTERREFIAEHMSI